MLVVADEGMLHVLWKPGRIYMYNMFSTYVLTIHI